ncbi:MAG: hypothetical protein U0324_09470 [Polyangiales bacterium]
MDAPRPLAARLEALPRAWIGAALTLAFAASTLRPPHAGSRPGPRAERSVGPRDARPGPRRESARAPNPWRWRHNQGAPFPAERAIITPLAIGDRLGPGRVFEIAHHVDARLMIGVHVGGREVWLRVTRAAGGEVPPRAVAGPFAVTVAEEGGAVDDADALAAALAEVIRPNAGAPVPPEMQPLRRRDR